MPDCCGDGPFIGVEVGSGLVVVGMIVRVPGMPTQTYVLASRCIQSVPTALSISVD